MMLIAQSKCVDCDMCILVVSAACAGFVPEQAHAQAVAGSAFFRWVEVLLGNVFSRPRRVAHAPLSAPAVTRPRHSGR